MMWLLMNYLVNVAIATPLSSHIVTLARGHITLPRIRDRNFQWMPLPWCIGHWTFMLQINLLFTTRKRSCMKAMFLVVPVSLSVCSGRSQCDHYLDLFKLVQLGAPGPGLLPNHKRTLHPSPGTAGKQTVGIRLKWLLAVHIYITQSKAILAANFFISFHSWVCYEESISITCSLQIYLSTSKPLLYNISVMIDYSASLLVASWKGWLTP